MPKCQMMHRSGAKSPGRSHTIDALESRLLLAANVVINEILANNVAGAVDEDGAHSDWIELRNLDAAAVNLQGWSLTDDMAKPGKWVFPSVSIPAGGYLVVFASGKNRTAGVNLHTNFQLDSGGEYLGLFRSDLSAAYQFSPQYPSQEADISYGLDGSTLRYFAKPTFKAANQRAEVVINEIHYDPDVKTDLVEFIELYNPGAASVDLSGAQFTNGVAYTFPASTILSPGAYLTVSENPTAFAVKFPGKTALGPWVGSLDNQGDHIVLSNTSGGTLDEVEYQQGFPWPLVGDAPGYSIELINPDFDNNLGGNWRSLATMSVTGTTLISSQSTWSYRKGTSEPQSTWKQINFTPDGTWLSGQASIGYGDSQVITTLSDMRYNYSSVYLRQTFALTDPSAIGGLQLQAQCDDGFVAWINGTYVASFNVPNTNPAYNALAPLTTENLAFVPYNLPIPSGYLVAGTNVISVILLNTNLSTSTDAWWDAKLLVTQLASPSPGRANSVYATNAAPQMRQLEQTPQAPTSNTPVTISIKATDPQGVASMLLKYQLVDPGNYIATEDAAYSNPANWTSVAMHDDGLNGDLVAGDNTYTYVMPAALQTNRRLIRYKITATDAPGLSITAPYADDTQPNFAYYVYDGIPAWQGAIQPGSTDGTKAQVNTFSSALLNSVSSFQLITKALDHENSQYIPGTTLSSGYTGDLYSWSGTIIYNGQVYDNIHYRSRGGVWRYAMGKNMWKFDLNHGHDMQMYDEYGVPFPVKATKINLGSVIQQGDYWHRGEQGLFEHTSFNLFNLVGVPASRTAPLQLRIVENASATGPTTSQYDDDFQGLYLYVEQDDGRFLDAHGLPDGNLYKMESGVGGGSLNNQGPTQVSDNSDLVTFVNTITNAATTDQWIRDNFDLQSYYSYRAVVEAIHHGDIGYGKNYYYYHNPVTNKWQVIPWDTDLTWSDNMYGNGQEPFLAAVLSRPAFLLEYRNRAREVRDLLYNSEQTGTLIDAWSALVNRDIDGFSFVDADRAMWDYNPIMASAYVNASKAGQGRYYQGGGGNIIPSPGGFEGMMNKMKAYILTRGSYIDNTVIGATEEAAAPLRGSVVSVGSAGFPVNDLRFRTSNFAAGNLGGAFAAMQWRIADVTATATGTLPNYEINAAWQSAEITTFNSDVQIPPASVQPGHLYRVRVRFKDSNGRWSHWSNVAAGTTQFTATASTSAIATSLRITELNYHPQNTEDEEFIELKNIGAAAINLLGVQFTKGILFTFPSLDLAAGESCVVVKDLATFRSRYSTVNMKIAGAYGPGEALSNAGEQIVLKDATGVVIQDFTYNDAWYPDSDGGGYSLVISNPTQALALWSGASGWRSSAFENGTPGSDEWMPATAGIVVNEILSHTDASVTGDWVEFYNPTGYALNISNWFLSDSTAEPQKYRIASGTIISAYSYVVFNQFTQFDLAGGAGVVMPFSYSELGGEKVVLSSASSFGVLSGWQITQTVDAAPREVTLGRVQRSTGGYDFTFLSTATKGAANAAPLVGPVVINELLYNPATGGPPEYVELHNTSSSPVPLYDPLNPTHVWKFTNGITFDFPQGTVLLPDEYVLVVPTAAATFTSTHPEVPASVRVFGPFTGNLDNSGETVALGQPSAPELDGTFVYYTVDTVKYGVAAPWPVVGGVPIAKTCTTAYSNDPANWKAEITSVGSPGRANLSLLTGDATSHTWTLKRNGANTEIYSGYPAAGSPLYTTAVASMPAFIVLGNSADDQLYIDASGGIPIPAAGLSFDATSGGAADTLNLVSGTAATYTPGSASGSGSFAFADGSTITYISAELVNLSGVGAVTLNLPGAGSSLSVAPAGASLQIGGASGAVPVGPIRVMGLATLAAQTPTGGNSLAISGGSFAIALPDGFNLALSGSADIKLAGDHRFSSLLLTGSTDLDARDNDIVIDYSGASPLNQIRQWIFNGIQGGMSPRLLTSLTEPAQGRYTTLAPVDNQMIRQTTWNGRALTVAPNFSQVIVKYTYRGDTDLNGVVDSADYYNIVAGMGGSATWFTGDVDNDGIVTANDLAEVSLNLGAGSGGGSGPLLFSITPAVPAAKVAAATVKATPARRPRVVTPPRPKRPAPHRARPRGR